MLDAGGGTGRLSLRLGSIQPSAWPVLVDASMGMLRLAEDAPGPRVRASVLELPFADGVFDVVVAAWVVETTRDSRRGLDECLRVLRPGGLLLAAYSAAPTHWLARLVSVPTRWVVEHRFSGQFLDPGLRPTAAHQELHRHRGFRQLAVATTLRKPPAAGP